MTLDSTDAESRIREQCQCTSYSCNSFNCFDSEGTLTFRADLDEMRERRKAVGKGYAVGSDAVWDHGRCLREFTCAIHSWLLEEGVHRSRNAAHRHDHTLGSPSEGRPHIYVQCGTCG
eukprot:7217852-Prorocentrum_lima.AAC.1